MCVSAFVCVAARACARAPPRVCVHVHMHGPRVCECACVLAECDCARL